MLPLDGKIPRNRGGLTNASTDPAIIAEWWRRWPDANVGIRTGAESGVVVLDVDTPKGGAGALAELERKHGKLPATARVLTGGGGEHIYFRHPDRELRNSTGRLGAGLDVRGDGGYVVAPPSVHESGRAYQWKRTLDRGLADCPAWLLEDAEQRRNGSAPAVGDVIPEGERDNTLTSLAGTMRRRGMAEAEIFAALKVTNAERCKPPLDEQDVVRIAKSIASKAPAERPVAAVSEAEAPETDSPSPVEIVSLDSFLAEREELPRALVGSSTDAFLPAGGLVIGGGLGGSTKTTFTVDAVAHFASGTAWCGKDVAAPLRVLIVENEGPRAFFREKLRAKVEAWAGEQFRQNVYVLRGPWGLFDFRNADHREALRAAVDEYEIDLVVADPLTNLGMEGAGSLDDTGKFVRYLRACGLHDPEWPVAFWLLHHLNKTKHRDVLQALSGAWDNWADTIVVLKADHEARLSVVTWGKIRYGSLPYGEQATTFRWTDGYGYERVEKVERDIKAEVLAHLASEDRESGWVPSEIASKSKGGIGANLDSVKVALKELETAREVVEIDPLAAGRKKNAHAYRSADSGAPSRHESAGVGSLLAPDSRAYSTPDSPVGGAGGVELAESADSDLPSRQAPQ